MACCFALNVTGLDEFEDPDFCEKGCSRLNTNFSLIYVPWEGMTDKLKAWVMCFPPDGSASDTIACQWIADTGSNYCDLSYWVLNLYQDGTLVLYTQEWVTQAQYNGGGSDSTSVDTGPFNYIKWLVSEDEGEGAPSGSTEGTCMEYSYLFEAVEQSPDDPFGDKLCNHVGGDGPAQATIEPYLDTMDGFNCGPGVVLPPIPGSGSQPSGSEWGTGCPICERTFKQATVDLTSLVFQPNVKPCDPFCGVLADIFTLRAMYAVPAIEGYNQCMLGYEEWWPGGDVGIWGRLADVSACTPPHGLDPAWWWIRSHVKMGLGWHFDDPDFPTVAFRLTFTTQVFGGVIPGASYWSYNDMTWRGVVQCSGWDFKTATVDLEESKGLVGEHTCYRLVDFPTQLTIILH